MLKDFNMREKRLIYAGNKPSFCILGKLAKVLLVCFLICALSIAAPVQFTSNAKTEIYSYSSIYKSKVASGWSRYSFSGESFYEYCGAESDVTIPASVKNINRGAIISNKKIRVLRIPVSVESIESGAFYELPNLNYVVFYGDPEIAENAFYGCDEIVNFVASRGTNADKYGKNHGIMVSRTDSPGFAKRKIYIRRECSYSQPVCNNNEKILNWNSSNKAVASVDSEGRIKALGKGVCTITAICEKSSYSYKVVVFNKSINELQSSGTDSTLSKMDSR